MKTKQIIKIFIDISMLILFSVLCFGIDLSLAFHEFAGIAVVIIFAIHIFLNKQWFSGILKSLKSKLKLSTRNKVYIIVDIVLFVSVLLSIVTGIAISKVLFLKLTGLSGALITSIHTVSSYACFGIACFHTLAHAKYLAKCLKKMLDNKQSFVKASGAIFVGLTVFAGLYSAVIIKQTNSIKVNDIAQPNEPVTNQNTTNSNTQSIVEDNPNTYQTQTSQITPATTVADTISLEEFLGKLHCTACGRACPLTNPSCMRGKQQAQEAQQQYYNEYAQ